MDDYLYDSYYDSYTSTDDSNDNNSNEESSIRLVDLVNNNDPSVSEISIEGDETEDEIRALFRALRQNTRVRKLDLYFTPRELRDTICRQLLPHLLQENSSVEDLRFPWRMTNAEFESTEEVLRNNNTTVNTLDLGDCDICGGEGGRIIAGLIRNNNRIRTIDLLCNYNLGSTGVSCIAAALGYNDCALKKLDLYACGIGDECMAALFGALQTNNSLEEITFEWEPPVSTAVLLQTMEHLRMNKSLQRIGAGVCKLSEEQQREWNACCTFVSIRNKMNKQLDEVHNRTRIAAREGRVAPVPVRLGHLLQWCHHQEDAEAQDSLVYYFLRAGVDELSLMDWHKQERTGGSEAGIQERRCVE